LQERTNYEKASTANHCRIGAVRWQQLEFDKSQRIIECIFQLSYSASTSMLTRRSLLYTLVMTDEK
jgi:hypothetical protein